MAMAAFKRKEKVKSVVDLPGVPAGTKGRVLLSVGITWSRYFVQFDNGVELSSIDEASLTAL